MADVFLFAGPTLARARAIQPALDLAGVHELPPVQRGDIPKLVREHKPPGVIAIVDGRFHQVLAVGHMEIRHAISHGWAVWGLSSLGAIRAREMHHLGMKGYGKVFELYCAPGDFRDDEVTLLHEPEPPYREVSEPLVHLRLALEAIGEHALVAELEGMYFGDRTLAFVRSRLGADKYEGFAASLDRYRIKSLDLIDFLDRRGWSLDELEPGKHL